MRRLDKEEIEDILAEFQIATSYKTNTYSDKQLGNGGFVNINDKYVIKLHIFPFPNEVIVELIEKYEPFMVAGKTIKEFRLEDFQPEEVHGWLPKKMEELWHLTKKNI